MLIAYEPLPGCFASVPRYIVPVVFSAPITLPSTGRLSRRSLLFLDDGCYLVGILSTALAVGDDTTTLLLPLPNAVPDGVRIG